MNRALNLCLALLIFVGVALCGHPSFASGRVATEGHPYNIMGISLGMSRADARARLQSLGSLDRETRKRQEVWTIKDARISHLLVGYDPEMRVRYVTAIARTDGPRIRYDEVADLKSAATRTEPGQLQTDLANPRSLGPLRLPADRTRTRSAVSGVVFS